MAQRRGKPKGQVVKNNARPKPITAEQAKSQANREIELRAFNPDYDQVIKRISTAPSGGLRCGSPPGTVI